jgi:hypothetical protein
MMASLEKMKLADLHDLADELSHTITSNPEDSWNQRLELENVRLWIAIRENKDPFDPEPQFHLRLQV